MVPVPEAGVAWALQLQDILFPKGQREKEEEVEGRRDGREKRREGGRKERKENGELWLGTPRSNHRVVAGMGEAGDEKEGLVPVLLP